MTTFDEAWEAIKAPLWTSQNHPHEIEDNEQFLMVSPTSIPDLDVGQGDPAIRQLISEKHGDPQARFWQSKHGDARGFATFRQSAAPDDPLDPYHQLSLFEMARDERGKGLMRDRLQEMIAELKGLDPEAQSTHVTHSEKHTADLWDKLVDEGLIDSASVRPWVTTTPEGRLIPKTLMGDDS